MVLFFLLVVFCFLGVGVFCVLLALSVLSADCAARRRQVCCLGCGAAFSYFGFVLSCRVFAAFVARFLSSGFATIIQCVTRFLI
uniref:Uncharacterized protein n=1 Tax=Anopheles darlingi TaxID=43151 RepID=A0A2M4DR31_ANODA